MARFVNYKGLSYEDISIVPSLYYETRDTNFKLEGCKIIVQNSLIDKEKIDTFFAEWSLLPKELKPLILLDYEDNLYSYKYNKIKEVNALNWTFLNINLYDLNQKISILNEFKKIHLNLEYFDLGEVDLSNFLNKYKVNKYEDSILLVGPISTVEQVVSLRFKEIKNYFLGCSNFQNKLGIKVGSASEILNIKEYLEGEDDYSIISPICKNSQDINKAFLLGANFVKIEINEDLDKNIIKIWESLKMTIIYSNKLSLDEAIGNGEFCFIKK